MADHPNIPRKSTFSGPWDPWKPIGTHRCLGWPVDPDPGAWGLQVLRRPAMAGLVKSFWSVGWGGAGRANNSRKTMCCFFLKYGYLKPLVFPLTISNSGIFWMILRSHFRKPPCCFRSGILLTIDTESKTACWLLTDFLAACQLRPGCFGIVKHNISSAYQIKYQTIKHRFRMLVVIGYQPSTQIVHWLAPWQAYTLQRMALLYWKEVQWMCFANLTKWFESGESHPPNIKRPSETVVDVEDKNTYSYFATMEWGLFDSIMTLGVFQT